MQGVFRGFSEVIEAQGFLSGVHGFSELLRGAGVLQGVLNGHRGSSVGFHRFSGAPWGAGVFRGFMAGKVRFCAFGEWRGGTVEIEVYPRLAFLSKIIMMVIIRWAIHSAPLCSQKALMIRKFFDALILSLRRLQNSGKYNTKCSKILTWWFENLRP